MNDIVERCARIAEDVAADTADGEGELYIARKIADRIRTEGRMDNRGQAKALLRGAGITSSQSFDSLDAAQLAVIQAEAGQAYQQKYGKSLSEASPTYLRKRFDLIQRRARS